MLKTTLILFVVTCFMSVYTYSYDYYPDDFNQQLPSRPVGKFRPRIVEGHIPESHTLPFLAYVTFANINACTGTIIGSKYVMTAWHCLKYAAGKLKTSFTSARRHIVVKVGSHYKDFGQSYGVTEYFKPYTNQKNIPNMKYNANPDDLIILKLNRDIVFDYVTTAPVSLFAWTPIVGETLTVAGYGDHYDKGITRTLPTYVIGNATIVEINSPNLNSFVTKGKNQGVADGDSGGPALKKVRGEYVQVGMATAGTVRKVKGTTDVISIGIFLRMGPFCHFIQKKTLGAVNCLLEDEVY